MTAPTATETPDGTSTHTGGPTSDNQQGNTSATTTTQPPSPTTTTTQATSENAPVDPNVAGVNGNGTMNGNLNDVRPTGIAG